jgi:hypothetical protein
VAAAVVSTPRPSPASAFELDWLNERRVRAYPRIVVALYVLLIAVWLAPSEGLVDRMNKPIGTDFVAFWTAGALAAHGQAAQVYDVPALHAAERKTVGAEIDAFPFAYPPSLLLVLPALATLPYLVALPLWLLVTYLPFVALVRRAAPHPATLWLTLALPAGYLNVLHGQAGFLVAALMGGALLLLERRPVLAGVLLGILTFKPQLGFLVPIALVADGQWRAVAAAAVTAVVVMLASYVAFGAETWSAFLAGAQAARVHLETGELPWEKMHTVFAGARLIGVGVAGAYALQAAVTLAVAVLVWRAWRLPADPALKSALLVAGAVLAAPYGFEYDLVLLALPIAWLGWHGVRHGFRPGEKVALLMAWLMPFATPGIAAGLGVPLGPIVLGAFFWMIWRRLSSDGAAQPT